MVFREQIMAYVKQSTDYSVYVIWLVDRIDCLGNCCLCLTWRFMHWVSEMTLFIVKFCYLTKNSTKYLGFFVPRKFSSKGLELSVKLSPKLFWKVHVNKKQNLHISLAAALLLHDTVHLNNRLPQSTMEV